MVDSWSFTVSLFFGNFAKSYINGAKMCNRMVAQIWKVWLIKSRIIIF